MSTLRIFLCVLAGVCLSADAHVTLPPGGATAGTIYPVSFHVAHPCMDANATTAIRVRLPKGFEAIEAQANRVAEHSAEPISRPGNSLQAVPSLL